MLAWKPDKYKVAGVFDPGRPATVARAKRVFDCCLRIRFKHFERVASFSLLTACVCGTRGRIQKLSFWKKAWVREMSHGQCRNILNKICTQHIDAEAPEQNLHPKYRRRSSEQNLHPKYRRRSSNTSCTQNIDAKAPTKKSTQNIDFPTKISPKTCSAS